MPLLVFPDPEHGDMDTGASSPSGPGCPSENAGGRV